jgi:hypothetical protein
VAVEYDLCLSSSSSSSSSSFLCAREALWCGTTWVWVRTYWYTSLPHRKKWTHIYIGSRPQHTAFWSQAIRSCSCSKSLAAAPLLKEGWTRGDIVSHHHCSPVRPSAVQRVDNRCAHTHTHTHPKEGGRARSRECSLYPSGQAREIWSSRSGLIIIIS